MLPFGRPGNWDLIFNDEFDADVLNTDIWTTRLFWGGNTNQDGLAMHAPDDAYLQDGMLRLRTQKRDMVASDGTLFHYTTGIVTTGGMRPQFGGPPPTFDFTYGYAEVRAKVASGQGLDSSFWLIPSVLVTDSPNFPSWGEIDVFEILGHEPSKPRMTYIWYPTDIPREIHTSPWTGPDFSEDWHIFGVEWNQDAIIWYVDGIERFRHEDDTPIQSTSMFLILSFATGGWFGLPDESTPFPSYFDIEYIRVWKEKAVGPGGSMIIHEMWTDKIDESGVSKRIYFHCLIEIDGVKEWHYFGTTAAEKPPTQAYLVNEYGYIQFPRDLDELGGQEADDLLYEMGKMAGLRREGITSLGV